MKESEWFSGAIGFLSGDGMVGQTVLVNDKVFKGMVEENGVKEGYLVLNGYRVFGSREVGKGEIFFPGYER